MNPDFTGNKQFIDLLTDYKKEKREFHKKYNSSLVKWWIRRNKCLARGQQFHEPLPGKNMKEKMYNIGWKMEGIAYPYNEKMLDRATKLEKKIKQKMHKKENQI